MLQEQTQDGYPIFVPFSFHGYTLIKYLGCGSTSVVTLVENEKTGQRFSAKVISKKDIENRHMMKSIQMEISILQTIDHPNIIKIYDTFEISDENQNQYIVMILEYCKNGDLLTYAIDNGFSSENQKKKIIMGFLDAIRYLHNRGISHGDIKTENILLDTNLTAKLCDFGYCRTSTVAGNDAKNGTLYYAAPELFKKGQFDTLKTDIWAIGVTLYAISELQFPFKDGDQNYIIKQIVSGNLSIRPEVDQKLRTIVESCTQMNPQNRPTIDDLIKHDYFYIEDETFENKNNFYVPTKMEDFSQITELNDFNNEDQLYEEIPFEPTFEL